MAGLSEAEKLNGIVTGVQDHYNEIVKNESASGGESIKPFCVDGAIMQCTMGSAPGKLTVIDHGVAITGKYAAHDEDRVPGTNIPSFGTCAATGKPCAPSPVPKWLLTDEFSLMTNKRGAAATSAENCALITDSILVCMQGGIIKFVTSGQLMTVGDMLEMLKALFAAMQKGGGGTGNDGKKPAFTGDDGEGKRPAGILDGWQLGDWRYFGNTGTFDLKDVNSVTDDDIYKAIDFYDQDNKDVNLPVGAKIMRHLLHEATTPEDMNRLIYLIFNRCLQGGPDFTTGRIPPNLKTIIEAEKAFEIYENNSNYDQNNPFNLMTSEEIILAIENETHQIELNQYVSNPPWACNPKQVIDVCRALKNSHNPYHTEFVDKVISEYIRNYEHAEKMHVYCYLLWGTLICPMRKCTIF